MTTSDAFSAASAPLPEIVYRRAEPGDARAIAVLWDMANSGFIAELMGASAPEGETWLDGAERLTARTDTEVSWRFANVAVCDGKVIGALIAFPLADEMDRDAIAAMEDHMRSHYELMAQVGGAFFLREMAVLPEFRGRRVASRLLDDGFRRAQDLGIETVAATVHETNGKLLEHYRKRGFRIVDSRPVHRHSHHAPDSRWLQLTCPAAQGVLGDAPASPLRGGAGGGGRDASSPVENA